MTFSDSESTGTESEQSNDTSQDEAWLLSMMHPVDAWMQLSTPSLYQKWRAFSNLTLMYHRAARDLRADLEGDELQLHLLREMCGRIEAEKESVQAMLTRVTREKEDVELKLAEVQAELARSDLQRWELV
jgi:hypothetical protein